MNYFDWNATTPLSAAGLEAWQEGLRESWQNPSSPYRSSARVHVLLESARESLANFFDVESDLIVFNSGATEGNNQLFSSFRQAYPQRKVAVSAIEHPCVLESAKHYWQQDCIEIPITKSGCVDVGEIRDMIDAQNPVLISVMAANNESGVLQPWKEIAELCRDSQVFFHCDAAQWIGKMPLSGMGAIDFVTGSAHKFGGPKGVGFMKLPAASGAFKGFRGGAQEQGRRAGTENYPAIAAMLAAIQERETEGPMAADAKQRFEENLLNSLPGLVIVGDQAPRLPNTTLCIMPQFKNTRWVAQLDKRGFQVSTGSACATGKDGPSHVLAAMGCSLDEAQRAIRICSGFSTTSDAYDSLLSAIGEVWSLFQSERGASSSVIEI